MLKLGQVFRSVQVIEEVRVTRPSEYLRVCALIVRGSSEFNAPTAGLGEDLEQLIEERRKQPLLMIERMKTQ
jgi:hypothetical protein